MAISLSDNVSNETISRDDEKAVPNAVLENNESQSTFDKKAFLSTFTKDEDRAVMRKVDKRFLVLIGTMYLMKNVSALSTCQ